ncbi:MAG: peptidyl-prolyl cis-trans isomerase [Deltaproteobacteria bacterium]|nr:peptidyl-prolyl cis-trans isomerase [Deltaproteobacteria bacterium]
MNTIKVLLDTSKGAITLELWPDKAPKTVANFVDYVKSGQYDGTIFHRVIEGFMVQGGGFDVHQNKKPTRAPIQNEATNGLKNTLGTVAMARTSDPHSATCQFFVNVKNNDFLNHTSPNGTGWGYCVFGKVASGMDVVDAIKKVQTGPKGQFDKDAPAEDVVIRSAKLA